jgi:hypothetical protein
MYDRARLTRLDAIECEIRRRIYWVRSDQSSDYRSFEQLLFQADKSTACLRARTICLRLDDALVSSPYLKVAFLTSAGPATTLGGRRRIHHTQRCFAPVDGEDTAHFRFQCGYQPFQVCTYHEVRALLDNRRILNDALLLQRRKSLPTLESILVDLSNIDQLRESVRLTIAELPPALQLRRAYDSRVSSPAIGWETKLQERILDYFHGAGESSEELNSFLVMQVSALKELAQADIRRETSWSRNTLSGWYCSKHENPSCNNSRLCPMFRSMDWLSLQTVTYNLPKQRRI